jgi:hypothetical protein
MGVGGQYHALAALPLEKARYPLYRRLGGPRGQSGQVRKILPPPGFDPRTVQPVASCYTNYAIPDRCRGNKSKQKMFRRLVCIWNGQEETSSVSDNITAMFIKKQSEMSPV